jgi:hypothetical protein
MRATVPQLGGPPREHAPLPCIWSMEKPNKNKKPLDKPENHSIFIFSKFQKSNFGLVLSAFVIFVKLVQSGVGFSIPAYSTINACSRIMVLALI